MRTATFVLVTYLLSIAVGAVWRYLPSPISAGIPDLGALTAAYLGLTVRRSVAPGLAGAIVLGYLRDIVTGAPPGFFALVLGITCLVTRAVQQRLYVRGAVMTMAFSGFVAAAAAFVALGVRTAFHIPSAGLALEVFDMALIAVATALTGPLLWRLFRRIDAAYARSHRNSEGALEGLGRP